MLSQQMLLSQLNKYRTDNLFCDVTLACDGRTFAAHKVVLSAYSDFFENIFASEGLGTSAPTVVVLTEIKAWQLEALLRFLYEGEVQVSYKEFLSLLKVSRALQLKGFEEHMLQMEFNASEEGLVRICPNKLLFEEDNNIELPHNGVVPPEHKSFYSHSNINIRSRQHQLYGDSRKCDREQIFYNRKKTIGQNINFVNSFRPHFSQTHDSKHDSPQELHNSYLPPSPSSSSSQEEAQYGGTFKKGIEEPLIPKPPPPPLLPRSSILYGSQQSTTTIAKTSYPLPHLFKEPPPLIKLPVDDECENNSAITYNINGNRGLPIIKSLHSRAFVNTTSKHAEDATRGHQDFFSQSDSPLNLSQPHHIPSSLSSSSSSPSSLSSSFTSLSSSLSPSLTSSPTLTTKTITTTATSRPSPSSAPAMTHKGTLLIKDPLQKIQTNKRRRLRGPKSWEFLLRLLRDTSTNHSLIRWEDKKAGVFRLIQPEVVAQRWGRRTGKHPRSSLSYENFARGLRYHYDTGALNAVSEKNFVYQFGPRAQKALNEIENI